MPLSDREQQILREIESQLAQEDPRFARAVASAGPTPGRSPLRWAAIGFVVGLVMLFGIIAHLAWGFLGFGLMLVSAVVAGNHLVKASKAAVPRVSSQLRGGLNRYRDSRGPGRDDR